MNSQFSVPIPTDLYLRVENILRAEALPDDPVTAIALAVDNWIKQMPTKAIAPSADAAPWNNNWIMFESPPRA